MAKNYDEKIKYDEGKQTTINRQYSELQSIREGIPYTYLKSIIKDIILTMTDLRRMTRSFKSKIDFVFVIGDAYVDHPSFGPAIISRLLERYGYKVCMIAQPDWKNDKSIDVFGRPRLGFLVCGGNMDSMVNHYSVSKKRRQKDAYSPGGQMGLRPDYATTVYCNLSRRWAYSHSPAAA